MGMKFYYCRNFAGRVWQLVVVRNSLDEVVEDLQCVSILSTSFKRSFSTVWTDPRQLLLTAQRRLCEWTCVLARS